MLAVTGALATHPHPHELASSTSRHRRMLARVRSYTPPQKSADRACSCEGAKGAAEPPLRRCTSEDSCYSRATAGGPWTLGPPLGHAKSARAKVAQERPPKVLRPAAAAREGAKSGAESDDPTAPVLRAPCPVAPRVVAAGEAAGAPRATAAGELNKDAILAPRQLVSLDLLCHDIGMADDPNERWRSEHEDTAIVLLRLHRTARVGLARAGGVLVPQQRTKITVRARSSSTGAMVQTQDLLSPRPLARQQSQGPPVTGLVRQKSNRPQRKCRSMTDMFEQHQKKPLGLGLAVAVDPELFDSKCPASCSSIGSPIGQVSPVSTGAAAGCRLLEQDDMIFAGLFDGHGGDECARFLQQNFYRNLSREISFRRLRDLHDNSSSADVAAPIEAATSVKLTPQFMHEAFTSAYLMSNLQLKFSGNYAALTSGATAVTAVVTRDSISNNRWLHLANVGDTAAILCTADPNHGMRWASQRLYQTHRASTPSERTRVISSGGFILGGRLNGSLAVTRAFGNHSYRRPSEPPTEAEAEAEAEAAANTMELQYQSESEPQPDIGGGRGYASSMEGLSVLPATRSINLDGDSSTALFLVLCCDGVTDVMSDQDIVEVVHEGYSKLMRRAQKDQQQSDKQQDVSPDGDDATAAGNEGALVMRGVAGKLSRWLVHTALKRGSRDNCSAIILLF